MSARAEAQKVVQEMGKQNGYIPPDLLEAMEKSLTKEQYDGLLESWEHLKRHAASSVKTYVREQALMSTQTRADSS